ncbi:hypothetical protein NMG60_11024659 [Bertholletia excelsa]
MENYKTLAIVQTIPNSPVFNLYINRPSLHNALSLDFFSEFPKALSSLDQNPEGVQSSDRGRTAERLRREIKLMQDAISAIERCRNRSIDIITACDMRYCTEDAFFSVKEVDVAITADLGTLQRLPGIVGQGNAMELALTGRKFTGSEAKELGLVSRVFACKDTMDEGVRAIAEEIAAKSPLAVTGTKAVLLRSRNLTLDQGLDYVATWNSGMLLSDDLMEAIKSQKQKKKPSFAKL